MKKVSNFKEKFEGDQWNKMVKENPKRFYALLLCYDEHEDFHKFIRKAWNTLDALSGETCDILTLETQEMPPEFVIKDENKKYLELDGGRYGEARITEAGNLARFEELNLLPNWTDPIMVDNGLCFPNRTECDKVINELFSNPDDVTLPGLAVFSSPYEFEAVFYKCGGLNADQLSELFQEIFKTVKRVYREDSGMSRPEIFKRFNELERNRAIKDYLKTALTKISLMDVINVFTMIIPKGK